jgi:uncharacterized protein YecT (DUF1311 family)
MRLVTLFLCLLVPLSTFANGKVVREMARQTHLSAAEIREHRESGCASGVQLYMNICSLYAYYVADAALNEQYQSLRSRLKEATARDKLTKAQRAWVIWRDANCDFESSIWDGGSFRPTALATCRKGMTAERTEQIRASLQCESEPCLDLEKEGQKR